ncbi:MAG: hypothetical protein AAFN92_19780, partial [Bacteroidota bacterium]
YYGFDLNLVPSFGQSNFLNGTNSFEAFRREAFAQPAINFGATHFWGHADIYVSINTISLGGGEQPVETNTRFGTFTGLRVYPWKTQVGTLRPFLGYKFSPIRYRQETLEGTGFRRTSVRGVVDVGLSYQSKNAYFYFGYNRLLNDELEIPVSRSETIQTNLPSGFFTLGANWTWESTYRNDEDALRHFNEVFNGGGRYGWFVALGLSSAFPLTRSSYFTEDRTFLDDLTMSNILPDFGLGYHFLPFDANVALAYRPIVQERSDGGFSQTVRRNSLVLEGYKFLGDYHGFAPFLGLGLGYERLRLTEKEEGDRLVADVRQNTFTPVLTFGWDIRPGNRSDGWLLRTNLRYTPFLNLEHQGREISLQQLEFNFIQLVIFPTRLRAKKGL